MIIRPANVKDIPQITAIFARSVLEEFASFETSPPSEEEMLLRMEKIIRADYPYLVAREGEAVLGYAYASQFRPRPSYDGTVENTVYVAPHAQRRGIARQLLQLLVDTCSQNGKKQMIAVIALRSQDTANDVASVMLHHKLGFEQVGRLKAVGFKHNQWLDTMMMQRAL